MGFPVITSHRGDHPTESNQRRVRSDPSDDEYSENFSLHKAPKVSRIENIEGIVRRQIEEVSQQLRKEAEPCDLITSDSRLSEEITSHRIPNKFMCQALNIALG